MPPLSRSSLRFRPPDFLRSSCPNLLPLSSSEVSCHTLQLIGSWLQVSVLLDFVSMRREATFSFRHGNPESVFLVWGVPGEMEAHFPPNNSTQKPRLGQAHSKWRPHNPCTLAIEHHYPPLWHSRFPMHVISVIAACTWYPISDRLAQVPFRCCCSFREAALHREAIRIFASVFFICPPTPPHSDYFLIFVLLVYHPIKFEVMPNF